MTVRALALFAIVVAFPEGATAQIPAGMKVCLLYTSDAADEL